ncbi:MAG: DUF4373 domain-containing protein [Actinobacteria bacterium]|nr:DUF4373 domain-containing protein [Actinomycetota bacterium]
MKEHPYFKHDCGARNDLRLQKVRSKFGGLGYGIYFMLVEILRSSSNYEAKLDLDTISFDLREDKKVIEDIIKNYDLFVVKKGYFYSISLKNRMENLDKIRAGWVSGGKKRWTKKKLTEAEVREIQ